MPRRSTQTSIGFNFDLISGDLSHLSQLDKKLHNLKVILDAPKKVITGFYTAVFIDFDKLFFMKGVLIGGKAHMLYLKCNIQLLQLECLGILHADSPSRLTETFE